MFRKSFSVAVVMMIFGMSQSVSAAPVAYMIPAGFEGYPAGTVLQYGGHNYEIEPNHTMLMIDPAQPQVVAAPVQYVAPTYQPAFSSGPVYRGYSSGGHSSGGPGFFGPGFERNFGRG